MPMNKSNYPENWDQISLEIRERDHWKCKWCNAKNLQPHPLTGSKVILTVAHLGVNYDDGRSGNKHDKHDCRPCNLASLCQRCHLRYDLQDHIENARKTRLKKKKAAGQLVFDLDPKRAFTHVYYYKKYLPDRKDQPCNVLARGSGKIKNVLIEFPDGHKTVVTRFAIRKARSIIYA